MILSVGASGSRKAFSFAWHMGSKTSPTPTFRTKLTCYVCNSVNFGRKVGVGVIHVACPATTLNPANPEVDLEPVVKGTLNVLRACTVEKVKRVVYISDIGAVMLNPNWPKDRVKDETCWSDPEYCRATGDWYFLSKTEAERVAFEYGKQNELDVVAVLPGYVFGPVLQPTINLSSLLLANFVKGIYIKVEQGDGDTVPNKYWNIVDARDIANAILLVYEKHEAEGRYICMAENIKGIDLVEKLKSLYPDLTYLENFAECEYPHQLSSEKLQKLGWTYRPLEETLVDSIENYRQRGLLD
ncbi:cinnamoyl-CoA reductase 1-like isoform X2 [Punica granatum]|uniref:Cinnamoyl-CoA reductase 1-like isoform X2 n=1 Tax=Punica granatum TaxID=22663 RepID=A0A6P8EFV3_PUNGR|nr:cinnamoyl-CoA reductase 1-like isoform X2 [Punica granatum]